MTFDKADARDILKGEEVVWAHHSFQRYYPFNFVKNCLLAFKVLKPRELNVVISTGAGVAFPFIVVGKLLGKRTVFIETLARVEDLSFTGKCVYPLVDRFLVQWEELTKLYPKALYKGRLL